MPSDIPLAFHPVSGWVSGVDPGLTLEKFWQILFPKSSGKRRDTRAYTFSTISSNTRLNKKNAILTSFESGGSYFFVFLNVRLPEKAFHPRNFARSGKPSRFEILYRTASVLYLWFTTERRYAVLRYMNSFLTFQIREVFRASASHTGLLPRIRSNRMDTTAMTISR